MLTSRTLQIASIEVSLNYPIKNGMGFSSINNNWLIREKKCHTKMPIYIAYKQDFWKETSLWHPNILRNRIECRQMIRDSKIWLE